MYLILIIAFLSLVALIIIHELGHMITAKKLGVKVDEFGIGLPPRIWGKKIGGTLYSINWIPFGGFVKIHGHEKPIKGDPRSFSERTFWQKSLIILGGVFSFWVVSAIILSAVMAIGAPTAVEDSEFQGIINPRVQIISIEKDSPAASSELKIGDIILKLNSKDVDMVGQVQEFSQQNKGKEVALTIQRGQKIFDVNLNLRSKDTPIGVGLIRVAFKKYPWYLSPIKGVEATISLTLSIIKSWVLIFASLFSGRGMPEGAQVTGIIGIFQLFTEIGGLGVSYFLQFVAIIAIHLALINSLPLPALDGGWFLFLIIEKLRGKPLNPKIVEKTSMAFFFLLIALMVWITVKDIIRIF